MSDELDVLIESVASARRDRDASGRAVPPPGWWDLPPDARLLAFDAQAATRDLERAVDPQGLSGTVRAVLERLAPAL
jgi:hypothetical protein